MLSPYRLPKLVESPEIKGSKPKKWVMTKDKWPAKRSWPYPIAKMPLTSLYNLKKHLNRNVNAYKAFYLLQCAQKLKSVEEIPEYNRLYKVIEDMPDFEFLMKNVPCYSVIQENINEKLKGEIFNG